jgi:predicted RNA-binding protein with PUA-like domain
VLDRRRARGAAQDDAVDRRAQLPGAQFHARPHASGGRRAVLSLDPKAKKDAPRWVAVDVRAVRKTRLLPLAELRRHKALAGMLLLRPGSRLSITPVSDAEWRYIVERLL